jgi:hypothetical protein
MKAYSEVEVMVLREKYGVIMKRLPQNADLTGLTLVEKSIIKKCMSKFCLYDMESCRVIAGKIPRNIVRITLRWLKFTLKSLSRTCPRLSSTSLKE